MNRKFNRYEYRHFVRGLMAAVLLILSYQAVSSTADTPSNNNLSLAALQADWVFSGTVMNENGERYNYYFQMHRQGSQFNAVATLIDGQSKKVLLFEENEAIIEAPQSNVWYVGHMFLKFNPINNSWIFGIKTKHKRGFNFKADMLKSVGYTPALHKLPTDVALAINQTGRLNGHMHIGADDAEQFVTGQKAWFRQIWLTNAKSAMQPVTGILCQFNDGSGFYSVSLAPLGTVGGTIAGWIDSRGLPTSTGQFVMVKEGEPGMWTIRLAYPKLKLMFQDILPADGAKYHLSAGLTDAIRPGFCTISKMVG